MEIKHKRTGATVEITAAEWDKMLKNGISRNYRVTNSTDKEIAKRLTDPPVEVIDFLKDKTEFVMADKDTDAVEIPPVKRRKGKGVQTVDGSRNDVVANAGSVDATDLPNPTLTAEAIELAHEEPIKTYEKIEFTETNTTEND